MSVNRVAKLLKLTNSKCLADGSVLQKVDRFSQQGVERDFFKNGQKIARSIPRLNSQNDTKNWLSMRPGIRYCEVTDFDSSFGEIDENNQLTERGICIFKSGRIEIGYW